MLTDDDLTTALRGAFDGATAGITTAPALATTVRRQHHRRKMTAAAGLATPVVAAGAVGAALWQHAGATHSTRPVAEPRVTTHSTRPGIQHASFTLDGYHVQLPAGYRRADDGYSVDGDCLVRTDPSGPSILEPGGVCPLHITGVVTTPPPGSATLSFKTTPSGTSVAIDTIHALDEADPIYLPTKLPDGTTVYVEIAPGQRTLDISQLMELAQGIKVAPVTDNSNPSGKPVG